MKPVRRTALVCSHSSLRLQRMLDPEAGRCSDGCGPAWATFCIHKDSTAALEQHQVSDGWCIHSPGFVYQLLSIIANGGRQFLGIYRNPSERHAHQCELVMLPFVTLLQLKSSMTR